MPLSETTKTTFNDKPVLRVGFVPLIDAAPLIVASELDYFADEGLQVSLKRQVGWGNVRGKLSFGHLDASHALVGMPLASRLSREWCGEPLVALAALGAGGNAITVSRALFEAGVESGASLARWIRSRRGRMLAMFAHVFNCSTHHYLLRDWLSSAQIDPDRDVRLCVIPPPQMARQMQQGVLDGFCVGEPWNTLAWRAGIGHVVAATTQIVPEHPEKVLAVSRAWLARNARSARGLVRAVLRGCAFCDDPNNHERLAELLSRGNYLGTPRDLLLRSLSEEAMRLAVRAPGAPRSGPSHSFGLASTFPSCTHSAWLLEEIIRWKHAAPAEDVAVIAEGCVDTAPYREVAAGMGIDCPEDDFPPMRLRNGGRYQPRRADNASQKNVERSTVAVAS
jgi:nitrate/nitrite transport system substrate-binding protein